MKETDFQSRESVLGRTVFTGLVWVGLHLVTSVRNLIDLMFGAYDAWSYGLAGAYALSLLAFDALLFFAGSRTADRVLGKYWGACGVLTAALLIVWKLGAELPGWGLLLFMVTPYFPLEPLFRLAEGAGWEQAVCMLLLAVLHLAYCLRLYRREQAGEKPAGENEERDG